MSKDDADLALQQFRDFLDLDSKLVSQEHSLSDQLFSIDFVIEHLLDSVPEELEDLRAHLLDIIGEVMEIRELFEEEFEHHIKFVEEEAEVLHSKKLEGNRKYRVLEVKEEKEVKANKKLLNEIHGKFESLVDLIKESEAEIEDARGMAQRGEHNLSELLPYLEELHRLIHTYYKVFTDLIEKEEKILESS